MSTKFPWGVTNFATSRKGKGSKDLVRVFSGIEYNVVGGVGDGFGGAPYKVVGGVGDGFGGAPYSVVGGVGEGFLGWLYDAEALPAVMDVTME